MNIALDTNAYSDLARGVEGVVQRLATADRVVIPFIVLGELRAGFTVGSKRAENERVLDLFLQKPMVEVLFADHDTPTRYAAVYQQLRHLGKMIPDNDLWIAALVLQHNLRLETRDSHFDHVPNLLRT